MRRKLLSLSPADGDGTVDRGHRRRRLPQRNDFGGALKGNMLSDEEPQSSDARRRLAAASTLPLSHLLHASNFLTFSNLEGSCLEVLLPVSHFPSDCTANHRKGAFSHRSQLLFFVDGTPTVTRTSSLRQIQPREVCSSDGWVAHLTPHAATKQQIHAHDLQMASDCHFIEENEIRYSNSSRTDAQFSHTHFG